MDEIRAPIRRVNTRIAALHDRFRREYRALGEPHGFTPEQDGEEMPLILYGIKQVSIDPDGYLRTKLHADEAEIRFTARLYAAVHEGFAEYVSTLLDITQELTDDDDFRAFSEPQMHSIQEDLAGEGYAPEDWLYWCLAHSYVCGVFAAEYPASLLDMFPTTARRYHELLEMQSYQELPVMVAMQLAIQDCLMCPREDGWREIVTMN
jgi:hypothetical protein